MLQFIIFTFYNLLLRPIPRINWISREYDNKGDIRFVQVQDNTHINTPRKQWVYLGSVRN